MSSDGSRPSPWARFARRTRRASIAGLLAGTIWVLAGGPSVAPGDEASAAPRDAADGAQAVAPADPEFKPLHARARAPRGLGSVLAGDDESAASARPPRVDVRKDSREGWALPAGRIDIRQAEAEGGKLVQTLGQTRIELTLDPALQESAERALAKYRVQYGALVVLRPKTGEVLALAELSAKNPDLTGIALQSEGPAASVFKVVTASALVEKGGLTADTEICTHGGWRGLSLKHLEDDPRRDKTCHTMAQALGASNNVAFARWTDRLLTPESLTETAERFLFGKRIPFLWTVGRSKADLPGGSRLGFAKSGAGFVGTTLSPLHGALIAATVANGGVMMTPRLVARATDQGRVVYEAQHQVLARPIRPSTAAQLTTMMKQTTIGDGSAAKYFMRRKRARIRTSKGAVEVAGKTGSLSSRGGGPARHYSWFVAFAPADDPQVALAALVVNGEVWTTKGAVVAREFLKDYFKDRKQAR